MTLVNGGGGARCSVVAAILYRMLLRCSTRGS